MSEETRRTRENRDRLEAMSQTNRFQQSIAKTTAWMHKVNRMVHVMFRQVRSEREHMNTNAELFLDQLAFELGPEILKKENRATLAVYARRFAQQEIARRADTQERREWREMQGPLAQGFDLERPMGDLPSDGDLADALCKANPDLKKYRKDLL